MTTIVAVEDVLLARVRAAFAAGQLRTVESLPGAINSTMIKQLAPRAPGVHSSFLGAGPSRGGTPEQLDARWALYVITTHASGQAARRRGDATLIGAYEILAPLVAALHSAPIPDCGAVRNVRIDNLWSGEMESRGIALFAVTFDVPMTLTGDEPTLDAFETFHADYDVPLFVSATEHQKWLEEPPDHTTSVPDAEDTVQLEQ